MKDSGVEWIGEIPADWEVRRIKSLAKNSDDKGSFSGKLYIGLENIESWTGKYIFTQKMDSEAVDSIVTSFGDNDVLFGKLRPYLAKVFCPVQSGQCSTEFFVLTPVNVYKIFLYYCLMNEAFINEVNALTCGAKMPRANWNGFGVLRIPVPSKINEQRRIASYLDTKCAKIDATIARKQALIEKLGEYKKSLIYEVVTGKKEVG